MITYKNVGNCKITWKDKRIIYNRRLTTMKRITKLKEIRDKRKLANSVFSIWHKETHKGETECSPNIRSGIKKYIQLDRNNDWPKSNGNVDKNMNIQKFTRFYSSMCKHMFNLTWTIKKSKEGDCFSSLFSKSVMLFWKSTFETLSFTDTKTPTKSTSNNDSVTSKISFNRYLWLQNITRTWTYIKLYC